MLKEGEELAVFVQVDKPCYLLFIQTLGDGTRVVPDLIYQNYYIDITKVNKSLQLPDLFVIKPPFGRELMQVFVSEQPFRPLRIVSRCLDGEYYRVVDGYKTQFRGIAVGKTGNGVVSRSIRLITVRDYR